MTALLIVEAAAGFKLPPNVAINAGQVGVDTSGKASLDIRRAAPTDGQSGNTPTETQRTASGEAAAKTTSQQAVAPSWATGTPGYDGSAAAAKDVLLRVASAMLEDGTRYGFCVTPSVSESTAPGVGRNEYFHAICRSMTRAIEAQVKGIELRNAMKQQCTINPRLEACKNLTW